MKTLAIYVDGGMSGTKHAGIAAVARSGEGYFIGWLSRRLPTMTNNEAEYHATLLGFELAKILNCQQVEIVSDSEVVVRQMTGMSRVNSQKLKQLHNQACAQIGEFKKVSFRHVRRELNHLADALATEAINGREVAMPIGRAQINRPMSWTMFGKR
jgi:ribonuclease HI